MAKLTPKQARFVEEYLIDLNATQAAIRAGYSERTARKIGHENLTKPDIAAALEEAMAKRSERTEITADRVLQELARIGFADVRNLFTWDEERTAFVPSRDLSEDEAAAIAEVQAETTAFTTEDGVTETRIKLKLKTYDKLGALDKLGKHLGLFVERVEHSGKIDGPVLNVVLNRPKRDEPDADA
jgi:phage terminase small subunit